jgi:hypothetical protein
MNDNSEISDFMQEDLHPRWSRRTHRIALSIPGAFHAFDVPPDAVMNRAFGVTGGAR